MKTATIGNALGLILVALGLIMLAPVAVALLALEFSAIPPFVVAAAASVGLGTLLRWRGGFSSDFDSLRRGAGMVIVCLAWVITGAIGAIPYLFFGLYPLDAYSEPLSGCTTTWATILQAL